MAERSKKCFWCGGPLFTYLEDGKGWIIHNKKTCQTCYEWDRDQHFLGLPGLQKPAKSGAVQMTLSLQVTPRKEAIVLSGEEFMKHFAKLLNRRESPIQ
jgi:hypothetical protein